MPDKLQGAARSGRAREGTWAHLAQLSKQIKLAVRLDVFYSAACPVSRLRLGKRARQGLRHRKATWGTSPLMASKAAHCGTQRASG